MADDKGASSGSDWGALEIILGILLAIGLLDHLFGRTNTPPSTATVAPSETISTQQSDAMCGLSLTRPKPLERVHGFVTVTGQITGCNWTATADTALFAQVINSRGLPVSPYTRIAPEASSSNEGEAAFSSTVEITGTVSSGATGYLILVPAVQSGTDHSISARIPIKF